MLMQHMILTNSSGLPGKFIFLLKQIIHLFPEILSRYPSHSGNALKMMKYITRLVVKLLKLVRLRATKK